MKSLIKKIIPECAIVFYHRLLSWLAGVVYGYPANSMVVVGVTGTNGKTTTTEMVAYLLERAGNKVGMISTVNLKIGGETILNKTKMTMLGRFKGQKMLAQMKRKGCTHAVIEVSSEGIKQFRHKSINFDIAVFTNLSKEHLDSHGGIENYRKAKEKLFESLSKSPAKNIGGQKVEKTIIANGDDKAADHFLQHAADKKIAIIMDKNVNITHKAEKVYINDVIKKKFGYSFKINDTAFRLNLIGQYNIYNAACAIMACNSAGIELEKINNYTGSFKGVEGRMEFIDQGQPFEVIIDYAHTPDSYSKIFPEIKSIFPDQRIIAVFGAAGGVRDAGKGAELGKIAARYCEKIIITNEDPWDTPPREIIDKIAVGIERVGKKEGRDYIKIEDRRLAIERAVKSAKDGDILLILGKGAEQSIAFRNKKIPWDDRKVAREILQRQNHRLNSHAV